jgi:DHA1 family multidrug resistance protein-like MFS transporter
MHLWLSSGKFPNINALKLIAPFSEMYGRKLSVLPAYFVFGVFLIGVATAKNLQTVMLCRFFAGLMASAPISNVAGPLADLWDDHGRALAVVG